MRKILVALLLMLLAGALLPSAASAADTFRFNWTDFQKHKIEIQKFEVCAINDEGTLFFGTDKEYNTEWLKKGYASRFHIFRLKDMKLEKVTTVHLPFPDLPQMYYSSDFKQVLLNGKRGSQFILMDLPDGKWRYVFKYMKGQPGFKGKGIIQYFDGKFYAFGYTYDKDQKVTFEGFVRVNLDKQNTPQMFEPVMDFKKVKKMLKLPWRNMTFAGPDLLHITSSGIVKGKIYDDAFILYSTDGKTLKPHDSGVGFAMIAAAGDRYVYGCRRKVDQYEVIVRDLKLKKEWKSYSGPIPMHYFSMSAADGGKIILSTDFNLKTKLMTVYSGKEKDGYKLKSVPGLTKTAFGALRMSSNGKYFLFLNKDGLMVGKIPE